MNRLFIKQSIRIFLLAILTLSLFGCCHSTIYQPLTNRSLGGYSHTKMDEKTYQITFKGNFKTSAEKAIDLAILHSAEVAIKNNYCRFMISDDVIVGQIFKKQHPKKSNIYYNYEKIISLKKRYSIHLARYLEEPITSHVVTLLQEASINDYYVIDVINNIAPKYKIQVFLDAEKCKPTNM